MTRLPSAALSMSLIALVVAAPATAGPGEPALIVEKLADPDPGFVPPPPEKHRAPARRRSHDNPTLDEAFENIGRIAGQAAQMAEQRANAERQRRFDAAEERAKAASQRLIDMACRAIKDARAGNATATTAAWEKDC